MPLLPGLHSDIKTHSVTFPQSDVKHISSFEAKPLGSFLLVDEPKSDR